MKNGTINLIAIIFVSAALITTIYARNTISGIVLAFLLLANIIIVYNCLKD